MNLSYVYIDWPSATKEVETVEIHTYDKNGLLLDIVKRYKRPLEQTMERLEMDLEIRKFYRLHHSRISKLKDETLIDLLNGAGKNVKAENRLRSSGMLECEDCGNDDYGKMCMVCTVDGAGLGGDQGEADER